MASMLVTTCVVAVADGAPPTAKEWHDWLRPESETKSRRRTVRVTKEGDKTKAAKKTKAAPSKAGAKATKSRAPQKATRPTVILNNRVRGTLRHGDRAWQGKGGDLVKPRSLANSGIQFRRGSSTTITKEKEPSLGDRFLQAFRAMNERLWRGWPGHNKSDKPNPTPKVIRKTRIVTERR